MKDDMPSLTVKPIGIFHTDAVYAYDVPRQGSLAGDNLGRIVLNPGCGFEQALEELDGFSHVWILFWFDRNDSWRPKVQPPRHIDRKVGVFASRSPYRPNPIGLSAVRLLEVRGREIVVAAHDILDGTPVLDIKPYLAYADAFPEAAPGWTAQGGTETYQVMVEELAESQLDWLEARGVTRLRAFALDHLSLEPENGARHRLVLVNGERMLAYRTWRIGYRVEDRAVHVTHVMSGYSDADLADSLDKYGDKPLHRDYLNWQDRAQDGQAADGAMETS